MEEDESSIPDYGEVMIVVWCTPSPAAPGPDVLMYVRTYVCVLSVHLSSESSHDDISTQDTGIDMHFYPGSPLNYSKDHHALHHGFPLCVHYTLPLTHHSHTHTRTHARTHTHTHAHTHTHFDIFTSDCCRNQEGRNSLQRAVDRSSFSELTGSGYDLVQDDHVGDPTCMAGEWGSTG